MREIHTWINRFKRRVDAVSFLIAAYHVVAHLQRNHLFVVETVFDDHYRSATFLISLLVRVLVFLAVVEFAHADADAELLATLRTLENQLLAFFILSFIKDDVIITFRTTDAFHNKKGI